MSARWAGYVGVALAGAVVGAFVTGLVTYAIAYQVYPHSGCGSVGCWESFGAGVLAAFAGAIVGPIVAVAWRRRRR